MKTCTDMTQSQRGRIHARSHPLFEESTFRTVGQSIARCEKSYNVYAVNYVMYELIDFRSRLSGKLRFILCAWHLCPVMELYGIERYSNVTLI